MNDPNFNTVLSNILMSGVLNEDMGNITGSGTTDRYTPTTITTAPALQNNDGSAPTHNTDSRVSSKPPTLLYPYETIFDMLYKTYEDIDTILGLYKHAKGFPTTSPAQKASLANGYKTLEKVSKAIESTIKDVGGMHV